MRVAFYCDCEGIHLEMGKLFVASVNKAMPGVEVFHLTNETCPAIDGAKPLRLPNDMPMGLRRLTHYASLEGKWLLCDSDVIVQKDVRHVLEGPVDVAVVSRKGTDIEGTDYEKVFPYNFGVVFSNSQLFWKMVLGVVETLPRELQEWEGEQAALGSIAKDKQFRVAVLPNEYNYTPRSRVEDVSDKFILHYKGPRKSWITTYP